MHIYIVSSVRNSNSHPDLLVITTTPLFQIHTGPQYWTFTFWATTAISKVITGLICWLHVYLMGATGHHCHLGGNFSLVIHFAGKSALSHFYPGTISLSTFWYWAMIIFSSGEHVVALNFTLAILPLKCYMNSRGSFGKFSLYGHLISQYLFKGNWH